MDKYTILIWHKTDYPEKFTNVRTWEIDDGKLVIYTKGKRVITYWLTDLYSWNLPERVNDNI